MVILGVGEFLRQVVLVLPLQLCLLSRGIHGVLLLCQLLKNYLNTEHVLEMITMSSSLSPKLSPDIPL